VDNGSTDDSIEFTKKKFNWVNIIHIKENCGFAEGNNVGMRYALEKGSDYIVLLSNDTEADSNWLNEMIKTVESDLKIGICGSKVLDMYDRAIVRDMGIFCDIFGYPCASEKQNKLQYIDVFYVSGCSMLIKRDVLEKIGCFDPKYFAFAEDLDLCWRAHLAGYKVVVNPKAIIYHIVGGTLSGGVAREKKYKTTIRRRYLNERNALRTLIKNYSTFTLIWILPLYFFVNIAEILFFALVNPKVALAYLKANAWNIKHIRDTWHLHNDIQKMRKVNDKEILKMMVKGIGKLRSLKKGGIPKFVE